MDATIMPSTLSLIARLETDLPDVEFRPGESFRWSPPEKTIFYADTADHASLAHEVSHALLHHGDYAKDIDLLKMERDAWEYAATVLAKKYGLTIDEDTIQDALDTYRDWLHARSTCPTCRAIGLQTAPRTYSCLACTTSWRVNEARSCELRRYAIS